MSQIKPSLDTVITHSVVTETIAIAAVIAVDMGITDKVISPRFGPAGGR
jgi:hypothetical protein